MMKKDEIIQPNSCLNRARSDELIFVLLGRDKAAPFAICQWCNERIRLGLNTHDDIQIKEALGVASLMEKSHGT